MVKKIVGAALAAILAFTAAMPAQAAVRTDTPNLEDPPAMVLQYDEPASSTSSSETWKRATLPIGNGIIGANVYGELSREHLTVNEETLWSGGRGSVSNYNGGNPSTSKVSTYNNYANQLMNGSILTNVEGLAGVSQSSSGYNNGYQALGDLYFTVSGAPSTKPSDYRRTLDLNHGLATVSYGTTSRTFFVSNPDNVLVSRFEGSSVGLTVSFTSKQTASTSVNVTGGVGYITVSGTVTNNGLLHNTQIAVVPTGGSVSTSGSTGITVSGASNVTIYLTSATDYKNTFWDPAMQTAYYYRTGETAAQLNTRVRSTLTAAVNKGYAAVYASHEQDYTALYNRVSLDLGQASGRMTDDLLRAYQNGTATAAEQRYLEVLLFQYGRYLLISGSRENSQLPTTLQGIWNDSNEAPWYSDIHTNINEQMNYWLSGNCNLTECALPLVQYMADLAIPGHRTVEIYTGSSHGIMAHTQNTPFGYTSPGWTIGTWGWSPAASTWLMQNCFDYYEFSGDVDTLRNVMYPYLKDQVLMYNDLLRPIKDKNGNTTRLVMPITQSPEINIITAGNTYEQSLIWQLYSDTIEAARVLGVDADLIPQWTATMDLLKPIEIGTSGQIKEWYHETSLNSVSNTSGHRHLSNMLGLYPGNLIDTEEELAAARVSLNNKNFGRVGTSNNPEGGWTYGQLINSWARVFDGENAYFSIQQMIKNRLFVNLWDYHNPTHFQIDANYGYSAGVGEMLVQSNLGYINLLPAIPSVWANGSVDGLLCEGNFQVSMSWADGSLVSGTITSGKGGDCSVKLQPGQVLKDASGAIVARYSAEAPIVTVSTQSGDVLTIESTKLHLTAERVWDGSVNLTWNALAGESYTVKMGSTVVAADVTTGSFSHTEAPHDAVTYTVIGGGDEATAAVDPIIVQVDSGVTAGFSRVSAAEVTDGTYLVVGARTGYSGSKAMKDDRSLLNIASHISGTEVEPFEGIEAYLWTVKTVSGGFTIQSQQSGQFLAMPNSNTYPAGVGSSAVTLQISASSNYTNAVYIKNNASGAYLNYRQDGGGVAGTWTDGDQGSSWYLYRMADETVIYERITDTVPADGIYVITGANAGVSTGHAVKNDLLAPDISSHISGTVVNSFSGVESYEWEIKAVSGGFTVRSVSGSQYLRMSNGNTTKTDSSSSPVTLQIAGNTHFANSFYFNNASSGAYMNYRTNNGGSAGTWTDADGGSAWYLFLRRTVADTFVVSPEVLESAEDAVGELTSEAYEAALEAARGEFSSEEEAQAAYEELVEAIRALLSGCQHVTGHIENDREPTCTEPGYTGDTVCDSCGQIVENGTEIPALGHTWGEWIVTTEPTCTTIGWETRQCAACGEHESRSLAMLNHEPAGERTGVSEPTCTQPGYTGDLRCIHCDTILDHGTVIAALGHSWGEWVVTTEPTCTENGTQTRTCSACLETENRTLPKLDHEPAAERIGAVAPTCTEPGYTGEVHCVHCDAVVETGTVIPALGHDYVNGVCSRCGHVLPDRDMVEVGGARGTSVRITLTGAFTDLENIDSYNITAQGFVIMEASRLGDRELTVNTPGRGKVTARNMTANGTWLYTFVPKSQTTAYVVRSFVCVDGEYIYSEPSVVTFKGL